MMGGFGGPPNQFGTNPSFN